MIVRRPRADEIDQIVITMEYYRDEANLPDGEYDSNAMLNTIRSYLIHQADHYWSCLFDGQRMVGIVAGYLTEIPWSTRIEAHIQFIYVKPSHRNKVAADMLLRDFEQWAENLGAVRITGGDIGIDTERTRVFYESHGYQARGVYLDKELVNE